MSIESSSGSFRVVRGGCCSLVPQFARVADRISFSPGYRDDILGLRLVRRCT